MAGYVGVLGKVTTPPPSGWDPLSLASLLVWMDPSDTATITHSAGAVDQVNDKSVNGRHHAQATAANKPTTGVRTINGLNVLDCDQNDALTYTWSAFSQPITVAGVVEQDSIGTNARLLYARSTINSWISGVDAVPTWRLYGGTALTGTTPSTATPYYVVFIFNGVSSEIRVNGVSIATGNAGTGGIQAVAHGWGGNATGGLGTNGAIGDLVITNSVVSGAELTSLESYFSTKWAI